MSYYNYEDFKEACGNSMSNVILFKNAESGAKSHFNLFPKSKVLDFIYNDGLEDLNFINTKDWENNPNPENPIKVDAYEFKSLHKLGYIAFMYNTLTDKWIIKSFKKSNNSNPTMYLAFQRAGLTSEEL